MCPSLSLSVLPCLYLSSFVTVCTSSSCCLSFLILVCPSMSYFLSFLSLVCPSSSFFCPFLNLSVLPCPSLPAFLFLVSSSSPYPYRSLCPRPGLLPCPSLPFLVLLIFLPCAILCSSLSSCLSFHAFILPCPVLDCPLLYISVLPCPLVCHSQSWPALPCPIVCPWQSLRGESKP